MYSAVLFINMVCCIAFTQGVTYDIINHQPGDDLRCNSTAIVSCKFPANTTLIKWKIALNVDTSKTIAAQCNMSTCDVNPLYATKYTFTVDGLAGVSNVTVRRITFEHNSLEFRCDDGSIPAPVQTFVREPPDETTKISIRNNTLVSIETKCIYPVNDVNIVWFSTGEDNTHIEHTMAVTENTTCDTSSDCIVANKSEKFISVLNLSQIKLSNVKKNTQQSSSIRRFQVLITYGSSNITLQIGNFSVQVIPSTNSVTRSGLSDSAIIAMGVTIPVGTIAVVIIVVIFVFRCLNHRRIKASNAPETPEGFELLRDSVTEVSAAFCCRPKTYLPGRQEIVLICQQANNGNHIAEKAQITDEACARAITLRINNLKQGCVYDCFVFARGNNIPSEYSEIIRIRTLGLPDAPTDLSVLRVENSCIHLSWIPGRYRMNHQWFVLELMNMKNRDIIVESIRMSHVSTLMHTVEGLPAGTTFIIALRAENDVGHSDIVGPIEVTTTGNPETPSELKEIGVTSSTISISWRPGTYRRQTQTFVIEYGRKKKNLANIKWKKNRKVDDGETVMMHTLNNLKSGTAYVVVIFARNDIGESKRTLPLLAKTKEENVENKQ